MARVSKGKTTVARPKGSFVPGSKPPSLYQPRIAPRAQGDILAKPPRIQPVLGQTQYGKASAASGGPGFGMTGLTGES